MILTKTLFPMNSKEFFWFLLILLFIQAIYSKADRNHLGFGFDNQKESVTIHFKSYNNLIIIEALIDDENKLNLILDTGILKNMGQLVEGFLKSQQLYWII
jgi:hypothetical protein